MKCFFYTFGCKVNQYETQLLREYFSGQGHTIVASLEEADAVIVNTCTVTGEADRQCRQLIRRILRDKPGVRIMVAGCYAIRAGDELKELGETIEVVSNKERLLGGATAISGFDNHARAFIKIQDGCDAFCSYCIVPYVRPHLWSKGADHVVAEVQRLVDRQYTEIVLSGVHLGKYAGGLPGLLKKIVQLPGKFRIRLSSLEISEVTPDLICLMASEKEKICAHLHLPLQSGSDSILAKMNRPYTAQKYRSIMDSVTHEIPDIGISTDIITGFPAESDRDFEETYRFIEDSRFSRLHVFPFSLRSGTPAATMQGKVAHDVVRARSLRLRQLDVRLQQDFVRRFIGKSRPAVREGENATFLTDNYIRLAVDVGNMPPDHAIVRLKIVEKEGVTLGVPV